MLDFIIRRMLQSLHALLVMSVLTSMRLTRHPGALDTIESVPGGAEPVLDLPPEES